MLTAAPLTPRLAARKGGATHRLHQAPRQTRRWPILTSRRLRRNLLPPGPPPRYDQGMEDPRVKTWKIIAEIARIIAAIFAGATAGVAANTANAAGVG